MSDNLVEKFAATTIQYVEGDATCPPGSMPNLIVHCCNDLGIWGAGFVLALSTRFPMLKDEYLEWFRFGTHEQASGSPKLGEVQIVPVGDSIYVANLIGQHGIRGANNRVPVRYEAIRAGLSKVQRWAKHRSASIHMPRMGAGLAGGDWSIIEKIIDEELCQYGLSVTVYDLAKGPKDRSE